MQGQGLRLNDRCFHSGGLDGSSSSSSTTVHYYCYYCEATPASALANTENYSQAHQFVTVTRTN